MQKYRWGLDSDPSGGAYNTAFPDHSAVMGERGERERYCGAWCGILARSNLY